MISVKVIAHRGFSTKSPENTLAGFQLALELGAAGIELDVHLSKDQHIVVCHDEKVDRTTDGKGLITALTIEELKTLDAGSWYAPNYTGEKNPCLSEVLDIVKGSEKVVNIELKNAIIDYPNLEKEVVTLVQQYDMDDQVIISSFNL